MHDAPLPQGDRGYELLLEHCAALTRVPARRTPAFERLEEVALAKRRAARVVV
jgi:hypothetical protein